MAFTNFQTPFHVGKNYFFSKTIFTTCIFLPNHMGIWYPIFLIFDFCLEWLALLWGPSWQEQACEWPEPCTWAGHRQGWPSKAPLKPFIGTCVDTQRVQGTCPDPVLGVLGYEKFGDVIFGDIHPLFYWWCDIGDVIFSDILLNLMQG